MDVEADDKRRAPLNCIHHFLSQIPCRTMRSRCRSVHNPNYLRGPITKDRYVPAVY